MLFMELGPGRGSLMQDILRTVYPHLQKSPGTSLTVELVEASPGLQRQQAQRLGVVPVETK